LRPARPETGVAPARLSPDDGTNRLGLTPEMSMGAIAAVAVFLWFNSASLGHPAALAAAFDPASLRPVFAMAGKAIDCQVRGFGALGGLTQMPHDCDGDIMNEMLAPHRGEGGIVGMLAAGTARQRERPLHKRLAAPQDKLADTRGRRCFHTDRYRVGDRGLHSPTKPPAQGENFSLPRWLAHADSVARRVQEAPEDLRDAALLDYFRQRKTHGETIHRFFGTPGLAAARARYGEPVHQDAIAWLRRRLADPRFASGLTALERAEIELLAEDPQDFVSCTARGERQAQN
jgi:hypothetical protein